MGDLAGGAGTLEDAVECSYNQLDHWKREHLRAQEDHEQFVRSLANSVKLFGVIGDVDTRWNLAVAKDVLPYDARFERRISNLYWEWRALGEFLASELADYIATGHAFEDVEAFRECLAEARGICTPDEDFFRGDALAGLRDQAIADHRAGRSEELPGGLLD